MTNAYTMQYKNTQVLTASPERLLIMLYDGAINFLRQATQALSEGKRTTKAEKIGKAIAIISELSNTLNFETGGEIADQLDALYSFMIRELSQANIKNDPQALAVVQTLMAELRETWAQAIAIKAHPANAPAGARAAGVSPAGPYDNHKPLSASAI